MLKLVQDRNEIQEVLLTGTNRHKMYFRVTAQELSYSDRVDLVKKCEQILSSALEHSL